jgi:hypothetical protein
MRGNEITQQALLPKWSSASMLNPFLGSKTTEIYTPVSNKVLGKIKTPLDNMSMSMQKERKEG